MIHLHMVTCLIFAITILLNVRYDKRLFWAILKPLDNLG